jgi:hypothetical protein
MEEDSRELAAVIAEHAGDDNHGVGASGRCELDSHADTCVAGANTILLEKTGRVVNVLPYNTDYAPKKNIPIATVATAWDDPKTGKTYIMVLHETLYFGDQLPYTLLNPNQIRANGLKVDETPRQFDAHSMHSIVIVDHDLTIPFVLRGIFSGFESRRPTVQEMEECLHVELTADMEWNPHDSDFAKEERSVEFRESTKQIRQVQSYDQDERDEDDEKARTRRAKGTTLTNNANLKSAA